MCYTDQAAGMSGRLHNVYITLCCSRVRKSSSNSLALHDTLSLRRLSVNDLLARSFYSPCFYGSRTLSLDLPEGVIFRRGVQDGSWMLPAPQAASE